MATVGAKTHLYPPLAARLLERDRRCIRVLRRGGNRNGIVAFASLRSLDRTTACDRTCTQLQDAGSDGSASGSEEDPERYLEDDHLVFGFEIDGIPYAVPRWVLFPHELLNPEFGEGPVTLTYCSLCNAPILYDRRLGDGDVRTFGSTGMLASVNKVMYGEETETLWDQHSGRPIGGETLAADPDLYLDQFAVTRTEWGEWKAEYATRSRLTSRRATGTTTVTTTGTSTSSNTTGTVRRSSSRGFGRTRIGFRRRSPSTGSPAATPTRCGSSRSTTSATGRASSPPRSTAGRWSPRWTRPLTPQFTRRRRRPSSGSTTTRESASSTPTGPRGASRGTNSGPRTARASGSRAATGCGSRSGRTTRPHALTHKYIDFPEIRISL
ncbi:DUF3179 domain-containing protein [Halobellus sp. MBLA0160]|uniref:DUF3179 domain-containing protein n=1 Tax=Halobellus ruber TaxID=2761102 RepID=A0A7J9SIA4_9EURY|nr:DUF3179 domain-containing protein [Halobellus ruber]